MARPSAVTEAALDERFHADGCPKQRTESYTERQPKGGLVRIVRCIDCGGQAAEQVSGSQPTSTAAVRPPSRSPDPSPHL